jgi:hypothetical protein
LEWAEAKALAADGVTKSEIARRLGINRRTAARLVEASQPPCYSRAPAGSMLDPLEPVLRRLIDDWPEIKAGRVTEVLRDLDTRSACATRAPRTSAERLGCPQAHARSAR